jgi:hypothetical protein
MPQQRAVELDAVANEAFAVIDEQPQVELGPVQLPGREAFQALLQRGAGDVDRVDRIRLAALTGAPAALRGQVRRDPQDALAATDQKPLQRPGDVPAVLKRPHPSPSRRRAHCNRTPNPCRPTGTVRSPSSSPVAAATAAIVCDRL